MTKYKWGNVRDFMDEVSAQHASESISDSMMFEAVRRMQIVVKRLCHERGLDEDPEYQFGLDVSLGHESTEAFERLKLWYEQNKPKP